MTNIKTKTFFVSRMRQRELPTLPRDFSHSASLRRGGERRGSPEAHLHREQDGGGSHQNMLQVQEALRQTGKTFLAFFVLYKNMCF